MTGVDTPISLNAVLLWLIAGAALLVWGFLRTGSAVGMKYRLFLCLLRALAIALLLIVILQPYTETRSPDREGFRVAVLADASHSMTVRDVAGDRSRIELLGETLGLSGESDLWQLLDQNYRTEVYSFSSETRAMPRIRSGNQGVSVLPGKTAAGDALLNILQRPAAAPLGAVLLLSDGNSNDGTPPPEACKLFRKQGIPVSCVGIGESGLTGDIEVRFVKDTFDGIKGQKLTLEADVTNSFSDPVTLVLTLSDRQSPLETRDVTVPANGVLRVTFSPTPWRAGFQTYALQNRPVPNDRRRDNDVDFAAVRVHEPDVFRILYLGGHLSWEYGFLRQVCAEEEQLQLASVIRTGPENYYSAGFPEGVRSEAAGFPEDTETLNLFDAVLLDTRVLGLLSPEAISRYAGFVEYRGGGLLLFGPLDAIPKEASDMFPVRELKPGMLTQPVRFDLLEHFIFTKDPTGALRSSQGFLLTPGEPVWLGDAGKPGARAAAVLRDGRTPVLVAQSYGSGRTAYLAMQHTWRWRLGDAAGEVSHRAFWQGLLTWLASSSKPRIRAECDGQKVGVGEGMNLAVEVLGTDFRPTPDAQVNATVTQEDGNETQVLLDPAAGSPGRYEAVYFPQTSGRHDVRYHISLRDSELEHEVSFLARQTGTEAWDTSYKEDVLRDVARITEGRFWHYDQVAGIRDLPLSRHVPVKKTRHYWTERWYALVLLSAVLAFEWFLRRRIGLK